MDRSSTGRPPGSRPSRPRLPTQDGPRERVVIACDVGGTRLKVGLVSRGTVLVRQSLEARAAEGFGQALERVGDAVKSSCREAGVARRDLAGFGLSFPGIIEPGTERILSAPAGKFDDARALDLRGLVRDRFGVELRVCNDANAALLGEWTRGAARGAASAVMMTLGTGIGTSAVVAGVPLRGQHGQAGCLGGHFVASQQGRPCPCGNRGCAETEASTWALPGLAREDPRYSGSPLARLERLDYEALFRLAREGDPLARDLRDRSIAVWGGVLVSLIHAYDPEVVVLGGGVLRAGAVLVRRLREWARRHAWTPWGQPRIRVAALGDDAALIGVARLVTEVRP